MLRLPAANDNPPQLGRTPDATVLAVTDKGSRRIATYRVDGYGLPHGPQVFASSGSTPFGFNFGKRNQLFVSEAPGSAASSYSVSQTGQVSVISASVADHQSAACWLVVS